MGVSFLLESGDKGDSAAKIHQEDEIPEMLFSDEGREFGIIAKWIDEKSFGYVTRRKGGEEYVFLIAILEQTPRLLTRASFQSTLSRALLRRF